MSTNIVIDARATDLKTKREAVEAGLRILLRVHKQADIRRFRMRSDR